MDSFTFDGSDEWKLGLRVWLERGGQTVLGKGRVDLLEAIDRTHSISAAARELGMSYRHAWLLIQESNERAGTPLIEAGRGGKQGGGARLTAYGQKALAFFKSLETNVHSGTAMALRNSLSQPAGIEAVHLLAAISLQEVVEQVLLSAPREATPLRVQTVYGASHELTDHLLRGMQADLFLSAHPHEIDRLEAAGVALPGSRRTLARNGLAIVTGGDESFSVTKPADLLHDEIRRVVLADARSPLGTISERYLRQAGVFDALVPKVVQVENSHAVVTALRAEQADVGLIFSHAAAQEPACRVLFRPRSPLALTDYVGVVLQEAHPAAAATLERFQSAAARKCFRKCGFQAAS